MVGAFIENINCKNAIIYIDNEIDMIYILILSSKRKVNEI